MVLRSIVRSFGDIHYNNELNNGMLPIVQPRDVRGETVQLKPTDQVTVGLGTTKKSSHQLRIHFEIDSEGNTNS